MRIAVILAGLALIAATVAARADALLSGTIRSAAGEAMGGVTVSAKQDGQTITTSVFTDAAGQYYFPPLPDGKYRVWAQALSYATAKGEVDLAAPRHQDFALQPLADYFRQLPGDVMIAALPEATEQDKRLKRIVHNNCTGCHTPSYILQHRFDEAGWTAVIELMKRVNVSGVYLGPDITNGILDFNEKELAAYLAHARGPGESTAKVKLPPRPTGEAARVVFREYDIPVDPELGFARDLSGDGSDWSLGTPPRGGSIIHDAWADLDGNLWFTSNTPNHNATIGRIDVKTGATRTLKVPGQGGYAAPAHGMTRDPSGIIWFNTNPGRAGLARLDPKTEKIAVFIPPNSMSPTGGATTVDYDGKGKIWVSAPDGVLRFDPVTEQFTGFKSPTFKTANGTGLTYGAAADRDGNGWWAVMAFDIVDKADMKTLKAVELKLPPVAEEETRLSEAQRKFYAGYGGLDFNTPVPWAEGPRRMGADKNGDVLWVGDSWGGNLARIHTHSLKTSFVKAPGTLQPYHIAVDRKHEAWTNLWTSDRIAKYDPAAKKWTVYDLPTRGSEARYISLLEEDGKMEVVVPYSRASKVGVMTFRSEKELQALKSEVGRQ